MLTAEQKNEMIDARILEYSMKIFTLEMDRKALEAIGDSEGIQSIDQRIESLKTASSAVESMKEV